jgi:branched-chain amino acid transport system permease protein
MSGAWTGWLAYAASFGVMVLIQGVACLGLNLQWGQTGLFNVGVAGFVAVGAYTSALLTSAAVEGRLGGYELPLLIGVVAAMAAGGLVSAAVGALTLRLRSDYLAIATFGIAVVVDLVARNAAGLTGGTLGISFIPRPFEALAERPLAFALTTFVLVAAVTLLVYVLLERLVASPWGRVLRAIREDERAAASLGKSAASYRLQAFTVGGALMGLAGALQAHTLGFISPENFAAAVTFQVWAMLVVGGTGNNQGVVECDRACDGGRVSARGAGARRGAADRRDRRAAVGDDPVAAARPVGRAHRGVAPPRRLTRTATEVRASGPRRGDGGRTPPACRTRSASGRAPACPSRAVRPAARPPRRRGPAG